MIHELHYPILKELGLTETEALIYEVLLEQGPKPAKDLVIPSGLSRGNVYNAVTALTKRGLATQKEGAKTIFEAAPPSTLAVLLEREKSKLQQISTSFESILPQMSKEYSFTTGKPVVRIFSDIDGYRAVFEDIIKSKTEVLVYIDVAALTGDFLNLDNEFEKIRISKQLSNKILIPDNQANIQAFHGMTPIFSEVRRLTGQKDNFYTALEIYDGTITYFSLFKKQPIAVIIKDQAFYEMHKQQFQYLWDHAAPLA